MICVKEHYTIILKLFLKVHPVFGPQFDPSSFIPDLLCSWNWVSKCKTEGQTHVRIKLGDKTNLVPFFFPLPMYCYHPEFWFGPQFRQNCHSVLDLNWICLYWFYMKLRSTLDGGVLRSKFLGPHLDIKCKANCIIELDHALNLSLHLGSPNHKLLLKLGFFFSLNQLIFPFKMVPCRFNLDLPLLGLGTLILKTMGPIYRLVTNRIALFH